MRDRKPWSSSLDFAGHKPKPTSRLLWEQLAGLLVRSQQKLTTLGCKYGQLGETVARDVPGSSKDYSPFPGSYSAFDEDQRPFSFL